MSKARWFSPAVALCLSLFISHAAQMLSIDSTGTRSGQVGVGEPFAISADGRFVAFMGAATNYVANDTNGTSDVFVHDCVLRQHVWDTTFALSPITALNGRSTPWAITPDGRYLLFASTATNLVSGITYSSGGEQLYVRDLLSNATTLVTLSHDGSNMANRPVLSPRIGGHPISSDGRFVSFASTATNLVPIDTNIDYDVYCRDLAIGATELITVAPSGDRPLDAGTFSFVVSTNGRFFAFETTATNVVGGIFNTSRLIQVYWRDRLAETTTLVTVTLEGGFALASGNSLLRDMSRDGRYVCFQSLATNLVSNQNDTGSSYDLFIRDMFLGETWLVTRNTNGAASGSTQGGGQFSDNGQVLIFSSSTANLVPGVADANGSSVDIFAHYVRGRSNDIVSASWQGNTGANAYTADGFANISATGRFVLFTTTANNLIPGSTDQVQRLYLRDLQARLTLDPLRSPYFPTPSFNYAHTAISETERYIFFMTQANFDPFVTDTNLKNIDLFRAPLYQPKFLSIGPSPNKPMTTEGLPNATYMLQASTNLINWTSLYSNTCDDQGRVIFYDAPVLFFPKRFYRLLWP